MNVDFAELQYIQTQIDTCNYRGTISIDKQATAADKKELVTNTVTWRVNENKCYKQFFDVHFY